MDCLCVHLYVCVLSLCSVTVFLSIQWPTFTIPGEQIGPVKGEGLVFFSYLVSIPACLIFFWFSVHCVSLGLKLDRNCLQRGIAEISFHVRCGLLNIWFVFKIVRFGNGRLWSKVWLLPNHTQDILNTVMMDTVPLTSTCRSTKPATLYQLGQARAARRCWDNQNVPRTPNPQKQCCGGQGFGRQSTNQ